MKFLLLSLLLVSLTAFGSENKKVKNCSDVASADTSYYAEVDAIGTEGLMKLACEAYQDAYKKASSETLLADNSNYKEDPKMDDLLPDLGVKQVQGKTIDRFLYKLVDLMNLKIDQVNIFGEDGNNYKSEVLLKVAFGEKHYKRHSSDNFETLGDVVKFVEDNLGMTYR